MENIKRQSHLLYGKKSTCKVVPKQQAGKAGWAVVLLRELWPWSLSTAPLDEHWVPVWAAECSQLQLLCPEQCLHRLPHPRAAVSNQDNPQHFLKCWTSELPEMLTLQLLSMLRRRRKEEFKSNQPIWLHCSKCLYLSFPTHKATSPTPQASIEDPATLSRFKFLKCLLLSPIFWEY